jgi:hypothetical protein
MRWTEGMVHVAMREQLRSEGWQLIAGQFPGGSDDELPPINVVDPAVARDQSPDPRRHSQGKLVPDLVALADSTLLVVEAKVGYSEEDRQKLVRLLGPRRADFLQALKALGSARGIAALDEPERLELVPALAQTAERPAPPPPPGFASIRAHSLHSATVRMPERRLASR